MLAYGSTGIAIGTLGASVAVPTFMHRVLPAWHGILGLILVVLGVLSPIAMVSDTNGGSVFGFLALIGLGVSVLATSFVMYQTETDAA